MQSLASLVPAAPAAGDRARHACSDDRYHAAAPRAPIRSAGLRETYQHLQQADAPLLARKAAALAVLRPALQQVGDATDDLPDDPEDLATWMADSARSATDRYGDYLATRKAGAPRRFFSNRAHALYFLQAVAPTKLVDGSWLFGTLAHARDPRMGGLVQTYLEELGNGDPAKNHVLLYRQLLQAHGLGEGAHLDDTFFEQGALQLALGTCTQEMLPEVIGFNLGYEQLPLHLLITAYELDELGIDPYYFTLHVTVDNADTGHARKAVDAVRLNAERFADAGVYWERVRRGYRLNDLGIGTNAVIGRFDIDAEVLRIFQAKSVAGAGAHSDYCRIEGRTVNEWLADPRSVGDFLAALQRKGWIVKGDDPRQSRFWRLLQGERAEMFGVFSDYELQVLFDWMRGSASADGMRFDAPALAGCRGALPMRFRAQQRLRERRQASATAEPALDALAPGSHWTPAGLEATQRFVGQMRGG